MGRSSGGKPVRTWTTLTVAVVSFILSASIPLTSGAADVSLSSQTYLLYFKQDVTGAGKQTFAPIYEYLSGDAQSLGGAPVSFHFYGWGRYDFADESGTGNRSGDVGSAYLQYRHATGNAEARLGRFFLTEGAAMDTIDGLFLKGRTPLGIGISVYGGTPVEMSIVAEPTKKGDSIYGGRLFYAYPGFVEIGASYLQEKGDFQGNDRKEFGGDIWLRPASPIELIGRATYNDATRAMAYQRYVVRITPVAPLSLSGGYEQYSYKDYFQTALNPVFLAPNIDNTDKVRSWFGILDWEFVKNVVFEAAYKNIRHDLADPGNANRVEGGLRFTYNDRKDVAGLSAAVVTGDLPENEYQEYRAFASFSPGRWRVALDALTHQYKEEINGKKREYQVVGSAGVRIASALSVSGDLRYTQSPTFKEDYAGLLRVALDLGTGAGGSK